MARVIGVRVLRKRVIVVRVAFLLWLVAAGTLLCMPAEVARDTGDRIKTSTTVKGQEKSLFHGLRKEEPFHMLVFAVGGGLGMACVITNRRRLLLFVHTRCSQCLCLRYFN